MLPHNKTVQATCVGGGWVWLQENPVVREAFMVKQADGTYRIPQIGELCCRRTKLADTLDKSECRVCWL